MPVAGRALVVHSSSSTGGARVGCGVIEPAKAEIALIGRYPGYTGPESVHGLLTMSDSAGGLMIKGTLTGLEKNKRGGWHVHSGAVYGPLPFRVS